MSVSTMQNSAPQPKGFGMNEPPKGGTPSVPPEWGIEKLVKWVGRGPKAVGKVLDGWAKVPGLGWVVRFFSSVWVGIGILVLIAGYIAVGSGRPDIRAHFEMTDLQFFDAWPMRLLLVALALDLTIVTLRRIPLTLFKLGSWTVHIGILTLITGSVIYFSQKEEGSIRIFLNKSVDYCYDVTERALYAYPVKADGSFDTEHPTITPLPGLPFFYEHIQERGNPLDMELPGAVPGGVVRVKGFYPFAQLQPSGVRAGKAGETGVGPAVAVAFTAGPQEIPENWLIAKSPAERVLEGDLPFGVEYLWHPGAGRVKELQASFAGPYGLTVRIPKLNIERTYAAKAGVAIAVEGSPYVITPGEVMTMPMLSKGYENAFSSAMTVAVVRNDPLPQVPFKFSRMSVSRYPERSPDFVEENGKQVRKQDGVDKEIEIVFQDATKTQIWIVEGEDGKLQMITRTPEGKSATQGLEVGKDVVLPVPDVPGLQMRVAQKSDNAVVMMVPAIMPVEQRPKGKSVMELMDLSMVEVEVGDGKWNQVGVYVPFSPFAEVGDPPEGQQPAVVEVPGKGKVGLLLSTTRRALPSRVTLTDFKPVKYTGAQKFYEDFVSTLSARDVGTTVDRTLVTHLNNPASDHGLYYFQAAWDGDDNAPAERRYSVVGVANRPGIPVMVTGAILMILGVGYAFYVKPMVMKAKKESLAKWAVTRGQTPGVQT